MTQEEADALLDAASLDPEDLVFTFALLTGLRPEEYLGLPRHNLSLKVDGGTERGVVHVRQVAVKVRGGGWELPPPKTQKGIRDVPFPAWLYHDLRRLETVVDARRRATGEGWTDYGLVFPSPTGAPQYPEHLYRGRFGNLLKLAGLTSHFTLYSLRYTFATLMYMRGVRDRVISDLMGHTRVDFTKEVYVRVLPQMRERASDELATLFFKTPRTAFAQSASELPM